MNPVEQMEVLVLTADDLEVYIEPDDELRQTYKRMTKEEVLTDLDEPLKEIDADLARRGRAGGTDAPIYWLRVSRDPDGGLDWDYQLAAVSLPQPAGREEEPCSQPR